MNWWATVPDEDVRKVKKALLGVHLNYDLSNKI